MPRYDYPKRPGADGAADRGGQHDRLAVDADRDLCGVGVDGDLLGGEHGHSRAVPAADESGCLPGAVHPDGNHAEGAGIEPGAPGQAGHVAHVVGVVADQQRLRALDRGACGLGGQVGALVAFEQVGQLLQGGASLVVAVGGAAHDLGVGAEGGVVDERAVGDDAQVHPQFFPVGEPVQAGGGVFAVQPEVEGEVVAGAGADHQERQVVLGGDAGHERLGPIPAGHPEQVGAVGHRLAGQRRHVHHPRAFQQRHLGAQLLRLLGQPELGDLPPTRPRVHDHKRPPRACRQDGGHGRVLAVGAERGPRGPGRGHHQRHRHHGDPYQVLPRERHQDEHRRRDHQDQREPPQQAAVSQEPVPARQHGAHADRGEHYQRQTAPPGDREHQRHRGEHQSERGAASQRRVVTVIRSHLPQGSTSRGQSMKPPA